MKNNGFLHFAALVAALLLALPAIAQSESIVTLSGNAHIDFSTLE